MTEDKANDEGPRSTGGSARVGEFVAGAYKIEKIIAEGRLGVVARAVRVASDTKVALKLLRPEIRANEDAFARFVDDADTVRKLDDPHIARVLAVSPKDAEEPFVAMEWLSGVDLDALVQLKEKVASDIAADFVRQACDGMATAHKAGLLHRDLKLTNLFLAREDDGKTSIKVLDFGLARVKPLPIDGAVALPTESVVMPSFLSPEQISGEVLDERTDVWSLGAVLYELVTGRSAFRADTAAQTLVNITIHQPPPMATFAEDVPEGLQEIVDKCLAKDRADRYESVKELSEALAPFAKADIDASPLLPERPVSIMPPPPSISGPLKIEGTYRIGLELEPSQLSQRISLPPASTGRGPKTMWVMIAVGALIGGILAAIFASR